MAERVAGGVDDAHLDAAEHDRVAAADAFVDAGDALGLRRRAGDGAAELGLEAGIALDVVAVVVGGEDAVEPPALLGQPGADRCLLRCVDRRGKARGRVVDENAEIVGTAGELLDLESHGGLLSLAGCAGRKRSIIGRRARLPASGTIAPMYLDVVDLRAFYASRLGVVARRLIGRRLAKRWPSLAGECVLGMGYATPYLEELAGAAERVLALMPAAQGVVTWPLEGPNRASAGRGRRAAAAGCLASTGR